MDSYRQLHTPPRMCTYYYIFIADHWIRCWDRYDFNAMFLVQNGGNFLKIMRLFSIFVLFLCFLPLALFPCDKDTSFSFLFFFTLTILMVSPESWFVCSNRILLFLIIKYQRKEAFIWQKYAKSKINSWCSTVLNKLLYFIGICTYNIEEAKNTGNNFANFRRCATEVGWNKQTAINELWY